MLQVPSVALLVIDVQEKLLPAMAGRDALVLNLDRLCRGAAALGVPSLHTEQYPQGLGHTIPELQAVLSGPPVTKLTFGCLGEPTFVSRLRDLGRRQVLVAGIETHVCVYQTAVELLAAGYEVELVTDAVASRTEANRSLALGRLAAAGARLTSVEMALFELLGAARGDAFKTILKLVK